MKKEELEEKYAIKIDVQDNLFYIYNYFGRLVFIASSLEQAEKQLKEEYDG